MFPQIRSMQDKSDFVHKGIDQAKEVIVLEYAEGIVLVAETIVNGF